MVFENPFAGAGRGAPAGAGKWKTMLRERRQWRCRRPSPPLGIRRRVPERNLGRMPNSNLVRDAHDSVDVVVLQILGPLRVAFRMIHAAKGTESQSSLRFRPSEMTLG